MSRCARVGQGSRLLAIAAIVRADADVEACAITARRDYWQSFLCEAGHGSRIPWRRGRSDGDSGHRRCCGDARRRPSPGWCVGGGGEVYFDRRRRRVDRVHARCRRRPRTEFRRGLAEEGSGGAAFNVHRPRRSGRRAAGDDGDAAARCNRRRLRAVSHRQQGALHAPHRCFCRLELPQQHALLLHRQIKVRWGLDGMGVREWPCARGALSCSSSSTRCRSSRFCCSKASA